MVITVLVPDISLSVAAKKWVQKVSSERLCSHLVIAGVKVYGLFQAERVDPLEGLSLNFDLLRIGEVAQPHA